MPINIEEIKEKFDTSSNVMDLFGEIFSKSNVVMFLWFLAIYLVISFVMSSFSKDGSVSSMNLIRVMDLVALCGVGVILFYTFFSKSQEEKENYIQSLYEGLVKTINTPISIFSIGLFIFVFYFSIYLLQIQMDSNIKPMSIAIIETGAWILMAATLIVTFFKFILNVSLLDSLNSLINNEPIPVALAPVPVLAPAPVPVLVPTKTAPALAPSLAPRVAPALAPSVAPALAPALAPSLAPGPASIYGNPIVSGNATIFGNPIVSGNATIYGNPIVSGNVTIFGNPTITGNASISIGKQGFVDYQKELNVFSDSVPIPRSVSVLPPAMTPFSDESIVPGNINKMYNQTKNIPELNSKNKIENFNNMGGNTLPSPASSTQNEVFNIASDAFTYNDAKSVCKAFDARLATYDEIEKSYNQGAEWCNYGWSDDQYVYMPTQKNTWMATNPKDKCGRPGINGGKVDDPMERFGVNCYGKKPIPKKTDLQQMEVNQISPTIALTPQEELFNMKVQFWKDNRDKLLVVNSFNKNKWSAY